MQSLPIIRATLRFSGFTISAAAVTRILGRRPHSSVTRGRYQRDSRGRLTKRVAREGDWCIKSRAPVRSSFTTHATSLADQLRPLLDRLERLPPGVEAKAWFTIFADPMQELLVTHAEAMRVFGQAGVAITIDVYPEAL